MSHIIERQLSELKINLPKPPVPIASYIPFRIAHGLVHISGQLPLDADSHLLKGKFGFDLTADEGQKAAALCAINILSHLKVAVQGSWELVECAVQLVGFVNATPNFQDHPKVLNGASNLLFEVMGEPGRHARTAIGVSSLPMGACIEINGVFSLR